MQGDTQYRRNDAHQRFVLPPEPVSAAAKQRVVEQCDTVTFDDLDGRVARRSDQPGGLLHALQGGRGAQALHRLHPRHQPIDSPRPRVISTKNFNPVSVALSMMDDVRGVTGFS